MHHILSSFVDMYVKEEERLGEQDFSQLLQKAMFHKSLLACCIEVVLVTYEYQSELLDIHQISLNFYI